jgi:hypothetical protein
VGAEATSAELAGEMESGVLARCCVFHSVPLMVMARHTEAVFLQVLYLI